MFVFETLHVVGTAILFFLALPGMDSIRAIMATNAFALIPGILKFFMKPSHEKIGKVPHQVVTAIAIVIQLIALIIWPAANDKAGTHKIYLVELSIKNVICKVMLLILCGLYQLE